MNPSTIQIIQLLQEHAINNLARQCLDALSDEESSNLQTTGPLPIKHVHRVLAVRAKTNEEGSRSVEGFDDVLEALKKEFDDSVNVYFFDGDQDSFTILTDRSTTRLLGVLISKDKSRKFTNIKEG
jgi:hypothetical protein